MKVLIYSAKPFEIQLLKEANAKKHQLEFTEKRLISETAMLALNHDAISIFSADDASPIVLEKLKDFGVKYITLRSAGHDNINVKLANKLKFKVANTPSYSPNAIAEHAIMLLLALLSPWMQRLAKFWPWSTTRSTTPTTERICVLRICAIGQ